MSWKKNLAVPALVVVPALTLSVALAGCNDSSGSGDYYSDPTAMASASNSKEAGEQAVSDDFFGAGMDMFDASEMADGDDGATSSGSSDPGAPAMPEESNAMIRRTASISIESKKYDEANQSLTGLVKKYSIVTLSDDSTANSGYYEYRTRNLTFRIKSEQFEEFCDAIEAGKDIWDVNEMNKSSDDVTKQYNDNAQQIEALRVRYDWYRQRLEQTNDENIAMQYSDKMFDALEQIKMLENSNKDLETDVAYSVVSIYLKEDLGNTVETEKSDDIWEQVGDELAVLPNNLASAFGMFVLVLLQLLPSLLVIAILLLIVLLVFKAYKAYRSKHPKPERPVPNNQAMPMYYQQMAGVQRVPLAVPVPPQAAGAVPTQPGPAPAPTPAPVPDDKAGEGEADAIDDYVFATVTEEIGTDGDDAPSADATAPDIDGTADEGDAPGTEATDEFPVRAQVENMSVWDDVPDATYMKIEEFGDLRDPDED